MSETISVSFTVNDRDVTVEVAPGRSLLYVLREVLDLTGTKQACDCEGECGACTVLLDGEAVRSCLLPIGKVAGRRVVTIEGLGAPKVWRAQSVGGPKPCIRSSKPSSTMGPCNAAIARRA